MASWVMHLGRWIQACLAFIFTVRRPYESIFHAEAGF